MANWLNFEKIQNWSYLFFTGFQYDTILNEHIEDALADLENIGQVNTEVDWEDDRWLRANKTIPEERKHAYRVAALVKGFRARNRLKKGISLDTFCVRDCRSCISDGHHRVRALQFLGLECGPFWLSGLVDPLEELVQLAGVEPPAQAGQYCEALLLQLCDDDIRVSAQ